MKRLTILFLMIWAMVLQMMAQKSCVIANAEDHVPIRDALIRTDNQQWARTDYRGYWTIKHQFDSATVSKSGFLKTYVYLKNLPDTLFMIPESHQLGTVEVWGQKQEHVKDMQKQATEAAGQEPQQSGVSFDMANMLDKRGRRDHKHLKKAKELLGEYEKKDPVVSAYEKETGLKYEKTESPKEANRDNEEEKSPK